MGDGGKVGVDTLSTPGPGATINTGTNTIGIGNGLIPHAQRYNALPCTRAYFVAKKEWYIDAFNKRTRTHTSMH